MRRCLRRDARQGGRKRAQWQGLREVLLCTVMVMVFFKNRFYKFRLAHAETTFNASTSTGVTG